MTAFQSTVNSNLALGIQGTLYDSGPFRADPYYLNSSGTPNIVGATWCTLLSAPVLEGGPTESGETWAYARAGGTSLVGGLLVDPHEHATRGASTFALDPTMALPDQTLGELATEGNYIVLLPAAAAIGDLLVYNTTTGAISTVAAGSGSAGTGAAFCIGRNGKQVTVYRFAVTAAGLGVVSI